MRDNQKKRPTVELVCAATGEKFLKDRREYNRQLREGATRFFKNKEVARIFLDKERSIQSKIVKQCLNCGKEFLTNASKRAKKCCTQKCASIYVHSVLTDEQKEEQKRAASNSTKKVWKEIKEGKRKQTFGRPSATKEELTINCLICGLPFLKKCRTDKIKTCSKKCASSLMSQNSRANPNCGGQTNYKKFSYKDISFDSSWEVEIAKLMDEKNIKWERSKKQCFSWIDLDGKERRYHPDFYLPDFKVYLDPKNKFLLKKDEFKIEYVKKTHKVNIVYGLKEDVIEYINNLIVL